MATLEIVLTLLYGLVLCPVAFFFSCSACCGVCEIFLDEFGTDNLATNYTTISGSWSVGTGKLSTATSSGLLLCNTAHPSGAADIYAGVTMVFDDHTSYGRLVANYSDTNNYWYLEVSAAQGGFGGADATYKLVKRIAGSETVVGSAIVSGHTPGVQLHVRLCFYSGYASVKVQVEGITEVQSTTFENAPIIGDKFGIGTGTVTDTITFDNFTTQRHPATKEGCSRCEYCNWCVNGEEPYRVQVELEGSYVGTEDSCCNTHLLGTFITERYSECKWRYLLPGTACDYTAVYTERSSGAWGVSVEDDVNSFQDMLWGQNTGMANGGPPVTFDCKTLPRTALNEVYTGGFGRCVHETSGGASVFAYVTTLGV